MRPGYGYSSESYISEEFENVKITRIDFRSNENIEIIDRDKVNNLGYNKNKNFEKQYFNHIMVNPSSDRLLFFNIWQKNSKKCIQLITCDLDGSNMLILIDETLELVITIGKIVMK